MDRCDKLLPYYTQQAVPNGDRLLFASRLAGTIRRTGAYPVADPKRDQEAMPLYVGLDQLSEGQRGRVTALFSHGTMRRRLQDLGLVEGTTVQCVLQSPAGDPAAYKIRGALIALRARDARQIQISPEDTEDPPSGEKRGDGTWA